MIGGPQGPGAGPQWGRVTTASLSSPLRHSPRHCVTFLATVSLCHCPATSFVRNREMGFLAGSRSSSIWSLWTLSTGARGTCESRQSGLVRSVVA